MHTLVRRSTGFYGTGMVPSLATSPVQSVPLCAQLVPKVGGHVPPVPSGSGAMENVHLVLDPY